RTPSVIVSRASVGLTATRAPALRSASIFAWAVPCDPEMIAPAWPIFLPGGAVTPAIYATTGLLIFEPMNAAAFSSSAPPISPISITARVSGSASKASRQSMNVIVRRDNLGKDGDEVDATLGRLHDGALDAWRRHEDARRGGPSLLNSLADRGEDRNPLDVGPRALRIGPRHHLGPVSAIAQPIK